MAADGTQRLLNQVAKLKDASGGSPCPECGGRKTHEVAYEDGTTAYPHGEPCPECGPTHRLKVEYADPPATES